MSKFNEQNLAMVWKNMKSYINSRLNGVATTFDYDVVADATVPPLTIQQGGTAADNAVDALINLGAISQNKIGKTLWTGEWTEGDIEAINLDDYQLFYVIINNQYTVLGYKSPVTDGIYGSSAFALNESNNNVITYTFGAKRKNNTLTMRKCVAVTHTAEGSHSAGTPQKVTQIIGII